MLLLHFWLRPKSTISWLTDSFSLNSLTIPSNFNFNVMLAIIDSGLILNFIHMERDGYYVLYFLRATLTVLRGSWTLHLQVRNHRIYWTQWSKSQKIEAISKLGSVEFEAKATWAVSPTERKIHIWISYTVVY